MCLIAYVPAGKRIPEVNLTMAHHGNSDGIGVMSVRGVEKFLGRKALKRARRYIQRLQDGNAEFAVHFRYATHGDVTRANCHPHKLPNGNGWLMHNGVLSDYTIAASAQYSDTALYAATHVRECASGQGYEKYWRDEATAIGSGNKLCVMLPDGQFLLVNDQAGQWIDGVWYSQTYSLGYSYTSFKPRWPTGMYGRDYDYMGDSNVRVWNPETNAYESVKGDPSNRALQLAYDRRDYPAATTTLAGYGAHTEDAPVSEWHAWLRDRNGNDPVAPQDAALDAELKEHLLLDDPQCCTMCGMQRSLDADMMCSECGYELANEAGLRQGGFGIGV
jgi:hypothetical protein